jgi:hypothetical protein
VLKKIMVDLEDPRAKIGILKKNFDNSDFLE